MTSASRGRARSAKVVWQQPCDELPLPATTRRAGRRGGGGLVLCFAGLWMLHQCHVGVDRALVVNEGKEFGANFAPVSQTAACESLGAAAPAACFTSLAVSGAPAPGQVATAPKANGTRSSGGAGTPASQNNSPRGVFGILAMAAGRASKGGMAGLLAGVIQVLAFMWLRTVMNYQYAKGGSMMSALKTLWYEGGVGRLYKGATLALIQAPLSRFGDTAANAGMIAFMDAMCPWAPVALKTATASTAAAVWRIFLIPIDTLKTTRQVQGDGAFDLLMERVRQRGIGELYAGAFAGFAASWVGNYPYFVVFNTLSSVWVAPEVTSQRIVRNGLIGMCSSVVSDTVSNSLRVLKTLRQSSKDPSVGYMEAAQQVIDKEGYAGLFGRGLGTRLLVNVLQGTFFTIVWKLIEDGFYR